MRYFVINKACLTNVVVFTGKTNLESKLKSKVFLGKKNGLLNFKSIEFKHLNYDPDNNLFEIFEIRSDKKNSKSVAEKCF